MSVHELTRNAQDLRRRGIGWFRFYVPLDGIAVACEIKIEPSRQPSRLRVAEQQMETLDHRPRLRAALTETAGDKIDFINLLLEELDMPWSAIAAFKNNAGLVGAVIEAAENRRLELVREQDNQTNDCA